jgi:hypothetical protein
MVLKYHSADCEMMTLLNITVVDGLMSIQDLLARNYLYVERQAYRYMKDK